jgi:DNA-3-methyladenine glycosylase I
MKKWANYNVCLCERDCAEQGDDDNWGVPVHDDRRHFEFLILETAQTGLSCSIMLKKSEGYRRAFGDFEPARYTSARIKKLHSIKIEAAVRNARAFLRIQEEFGSCDSYCWHFVNGRPELNRWKAIREIPAVSRESDAFSKDLKQRGFT